jgi:hypothetical protein
MFLRNVGVLPHLLLGLIYRRNQVRSESSVAMLMTEKQLN